jgi:hypothetical protein
LEVPDSIDLRAQQEEVDVGLALMGLGSAFRVFSRLEHCVFYASDQHNESDELYFELSRFNLNLIVSMLFELFVDDVK